ncbi:hypothetical protein ACFQPG_11090 [Sphingomonas sp. GCM10030256]|uniref:hypothetical protein n=1 Tax=Sphingomonas sp. GCM10030256 TaxID=3273427 RepID=UPI00360AEA5E
MHKLSLIVAASLALTGSPAFANSLVAPGPREKIARSSLGAVPQNEWNKLTARGGRNVEVWTLDGDALNKVTFYGGIEVGKPLLREADKKDAPLPRVTPNMLITDIPAILESTYRVQLGVSQMSIDTQEPALIAGHKGIRFTYRFVRQDEEVARKGEAVGAFVGNRLYLVAYEAPAIHFFDKDVDKFRQLAASLKF